MTVERYLRLIAGFFVAAVGRPWLLGPPGLVPVHSFCGREPVPVGLHKLVPHDDHPAQAGRESLNH